MKPDDFKILLEANVARAKNIAVFSYHWPGAANVPDTISLNIGKIVAFLQGQIKSKKITGCSAPEDVIVIYNYQAVGVETDPPLYELTYAIAKKSDQNPSPKNYAYTRYRDIPSPAHTIYINGKTEEIVDSDYLLAHTKGLAPEEKCTGSVIDSYANYKALCCYSVVYGLGIHKNPLMIEELCSGRHNKTGVVKASTAFNSLQEAQDFLAKQEKAGFQGYIAEMACDKSDYELTKAKEFSTNLLKLFDLTGKVLKLTNVVVILVNSPSFSPHVRSLTAMRQS